MTPQDPSPAAFITKRGSRHAIVRVSMTLDVELDSYRGESQDEMTERAITALVSAEIKTQDGTFKISEVLPADGDEPEWMRS